MLTDALDMMALCQEQLLLPINVFFTGEAAVDHGGPRREFATLLMQAFARSGMMSGTIYMCPFYAINHNV